MGHSKNNWVILTTHDKKNTDENSIDIKKNDDDGTNDTKDWYDRLLITRQQHEFLVIMIQTGDFYSHLCCCSCITLLCCYNRTKLARIAIMTRRINTMMTTKVTAATCLSASLLGRTVSGVIHLTWIHWTQPHAIPIEMKFTETPMLKGTDYLKHKQVFVDFDKDDDGRKVWANYCCTDSRLISKFNKFSVVFAN